MAIQEFQIGGEGGGASVLKKINYAFYKHGMLTTIKVYAYYAANIHKNKLIGLLSNCHATNYI